MYWLIFDELTNKLKQTQMYDIKKKSNCIYCYSVLARYGF